jgi:hypothetical protein
MFEVGYVGCDHPSQFGWVVVVPWRVCFLLLFLSFSGGAACGARNVGTTYKPGAEAATRSSCAGIHPGGVHARALAHVLSLVKMEFVVFSTLAFYYLSSHTSTSTTCPASNALPLLLPLLPTHYWINNGIFSLVCLFRNAHAILSRNVRGESWRFVLGKVSVFGARGSGAAKP